MSHNAGILEPPLAVGSLDRPLKPPPATWPRVAEAPSVASPEAAITAAREGTRRVIVFLRFLIAAAVLLPAAALVVIGREDYLASRAEAEGQVQRTVESMRQHMLTLLETGELALNWVLSEVDRTPDVPPPAEISALLRKINAGKEHIASIWVVDASGKTVASSRSVPDRLDVSDRDYFLAQRDRDAGTFASSPYRGRVTGAIIFNLSRRRSLPDGGFGGVVATAVSTRYLQDFFLRTGAGPGRVAMLLRRDGEILAESPVGTGEERRVIADAVVSAGSDQGAVWHRSGGSLIPGLFAFRKLDHYPFYVAFAIDPSGAMPPWLAELAFDGILLILCAVGLVLVTALALRRAQREEAALICLAIEARERANVEAQFRQAQKMEALGELTSSVAHDFNNLLTGIRLYVDMIRSCAKEGEVSKLAEAVGEQVNRADSLIASLLAFARRQPLAMQRFDVNVAINEIAGLLRQSVGPGVKIERAPAPDLWPACADPNQTQVAILNLVINARDAMPTGGVLRIATGNVELSGVPDGLAGPFIRVTVSDTGTGMTPEVASRAFEPFFTTKAHGKGSGLGLSSVYGFARQSRGTAVIDSAPGGTRVHVYLPRHA